MRTKPAFHKYALLLGLLATLNPQLSTCCGQGVLTPPGAPAPTMKSLAQIEPRTPISSLPFTIGNSGSYYLTTNLYGTNGITIQANEVSLDLNGFALVSESSVVVTGIVALAQSNLRIHNGKLSNWTVAVAGLSSQTVLEDLDIQGAGIGGMTNVMVGAQCRVSRCMISNSGNSGLGLVVGDRSIVENCQIYGNRIGGVIMGNLCQLLNCVVKQNPLGPGATTGAYCILRGNIIDGNGSGLSVTTSCVVRENEISNNNNAFAVGVSFSGNFNRIEDNLINFNGAFGISNSVSGSAHNLVIRNFVGGQVSNISLSGQQVVGPIITTTGTITNSSPWANFAY
jgi:hypothetical protein